MRRTLAACGRLRALTACARRAGEGSGNPPDTFKKPIMTLPTFLTDELYLCLLNNGRLAQSAEFDAYPVVKLFTPDAGATWLLTELNPDEPDIAFGLCDLGTGDPELGYVRLSELQTVRGKLGLRIERDLYFRPDRPLSEYARLARAEGRIVT